jgi:hypothetical protein
MFKEAYRWKLERQWRAVGGEGGGEEQLGAGCWVLVVAVCIIFDWIRPSVASPCLLLSAFPPSYYSTAADVSGPFLCGAARRIVPALSHGPSLRQLAEWELNAPHH